MVRKAGMRLSKRDITTLDARNADAFLTWMNLSTKESMKEYLEKLVLAFHIINGIPGVMPRLQQLSHKH